MTPSGLGDVKIKLAVTEHGSWIRARDAPLDKRVASKIHNLNKFKKKQQQMVKPFTGYRKQRQQQRKAHITCITEKKT